MKKADENRGKTGRKLFERESTARNRARTKIRNASPQQKKKTGHAPVRNTKARPVNGSTKSQRHFFWAECCPRYVVDETTHLFMRMVPSNFMLHPVMLFTCLARRKQKTERSALQPRKYNDTPTTTNYTTKLDAKHGHVPRYLEVQV